MRYLQRSRMKTPIFAALLSSALMLTVTTLAVTLTTALPAVSVRADTGLDERQLKELRRDAQRERRALRKARNQQLNDAVTTLRLEVGDMASHYQERVRAVDTEFDLERVRLEAATESEVAALEAALQKRLAGTLTAASEAELLNRLSAMEEETAAHQDAVFAARKSGAMRVHEAQLAAEERKDALLSERDQRVLNRAKALGLMQTPQPIIASPIGGELTRTELQWNEREQREVERLHERHLGLLGDYLHGAKLRAWERRNLDEDFALEWQERSELQALESQQRMLNPGLLQAGGAADPVRQEAVRQMTEAAEQQRQIKIRYDQLRRERDILRREEKRRLTAPE
ncbi:hypothetical protein [Haliea sp.]|uniref:hypothetical protein n=1 Tax=Haliea sp. TaxID=1932666 RepID=UPI0035276E40